jgi:hypothetical protein
VIELVWRSMEMLGESLDGLEVVVNRVFGVVAPLEFLQHRASEMGRSSGKGHGAKTVAARERAIVALLLAPSIASAAKRAGVGERTLRRWMSDDAAFKAELAAAGRATFEAAIDRIQAMTARAVDTLNDLLGAMKHPAVRLGAARTIVELALNRHDAETLLHRLEELEQRQPKVKR